MKEVIVERSWSDIILPADQAAKLVEILAQGITLEHAHARREVDGEKYGVTASAPYRGKGVTLQIKGLPDDLLKSEKEAQKLAEARVEEQVAEKLATRAEKFAAEQREREEADKGGELGLDEAPAGRTPILVTGDPFADDVLNAHLAAENAAADRGEKF